MDNNITQQIWSMLCSPTVWKVCTLKLLKKENIKGQDRTFLEMLAATENYTQYIEAIKNGNYVWSIPRKIEIEKIGSSKKRIVYVHSIEDRLTLGVLNEVFGYTYKNEISKSVFSYREGERTLSAVKSIIRDHTVFDKYSVKLDISAYFNSVAEQPLRKMIDNELNVNSQVHKLLTSLLFYNKVTKSKLEEIDNKKVRVPYVIDEYMSLIPGSAFSSFLANYVLKDLDRWLEQQENITYARYSDDMIIFGDSKEQLQQIIKGILSYLDKLGLTINPDKYTYYNPGDPITFLGLTFGKKDGVVTVDVASKTALKMRRKIKHEVKMARKRVELKKKNPDKEVAKVIHKMNSLIYKTFIFDEGKYGWAYYVFNNINTIKTLRELDFYFINSLRYIYTGKHNKANARIPKEKLETLGLLSFIEMYNCFKIDKAYYREKVYEIVPVFIDQLPSTEVNIEYAEDVVEPW